MNIVEMTEAQLTEIQTWGHNNLTEYKTIPFRIPFQGEAFQLHIKLNKPDLPAESLVYYHRKLSDDIHDITMLFNEREIFKISINVINVREYTIEKIYRIDEEYLAILFLDANQDDDKADSMLHGIIKESGDAILGTANYFIFHENDFTHEQSKEIRTIKKNGKIQKAKGKHRYININRYKLVASVPTRSEKTMIKRMIRCEAWGVRGHIRRYKSGKEVYIKPYVKGKNKDKVSPKDSIYKI